MEQSAVKELLSHVLASLDTGWRSGNFVLIGRRFGAV